MLPKSWYTVQEGQNSFTLREFSAAAGQDRPEDVKVTLSPANYNRKSLANSVSAAMTHASPNGYTYAITYPNSMTHGDDGKYIFNVLTALGDIPGFPSAIIVPDRKESNMFELLGFGDLSVNTFVAGTLKSTNVVKIQNEDTVRIHCNVCDNNGDDILAEIYVLGSPTYSNIIWDCPDIIAYSKPLTNKTTTTYEISVTNEDNVPLHLNGLNFCIQVLLFEEPVMN